MIRKTDAMDDGRCENIYFEESFMLSSKKLTGRNPSLQLIIAE